MLLRRTCGGRSVVGRGGGGVIGKGAKILMTCRE